jgi:hypothetical protein
MDMTKEEMLKRYEVLGFALGYCIVRDKASGQEGTLEFYQQGDTRYYHHFQSA